ncbi:MAG: homoserine kinase [Proteobacteria bacterium]|nr:homoserine kinase [Pseudomonadota bacterium]
MAVYTKIGFEEIADFLTQYDLGTLEEFKGIAEGVENTNYQITTVQGGARARYILTLFEQRVNTQDLPFFLGLTQWLADRGVSCPRPALTRAGALTSQLAGKSAAIVHFLEGRGNPHITPRHLELTGDLIARMHLAAQGFSLSRANALSLAGWQTLFTRFAPQTDRIAAGLENTIADELIFLASNWPRDLPAGIIHADIFPDNVFFIDGHTDRPELSGIIDFYFACHDFWMYDLLICMNAWCFDTSHRFVPARAQALLSAYNRVRPITAEEKAAMPILARGAAIRFLMTRAHDWLIRVEGALVNPKDPMEYVAKLHFHQQVDDYRAYGLA